KISFNVKSSAPFTASHGFLRNRTSSAMFQMKLANPVMLSVVHWFAGISRPSAIPESITADGIRRKSQSRIGSHAVVGAPRVLDGANERSSLTGPVANKTSFVRDRTGQTTTEKDPNGNTITTERDNAARVRRVTDRHARKREWCGVGDG